MGIENYMAFMVTALLFIMAPGMDTVFVLNKTISQGKSSGKFAALGVNAGIIVHTLFAAVGLSILVAQSEYAFTAIKYLGALYIAFLGMKQLRKKENPTLAIGEMQITSNHKKDFVSGFLTNALNPKVALFFLAFFPQFITPGEIQNPLPFLLLGLTYTILGIGWYLCLTYFAGTFTQKIQNNPKSNVWINKISGIIFILMGIGIAVS